MADNEGKTDQKNVTEVKKTVTKSHQTTTHPDNHIQKIVTITDTQEHAPTEEPADPKSTVLKSTTIDTTQTITDSHTPKNHTVEIDTITTEKSLKTPSSPAPSKAAGLLTPMMGVRLAWALTGAFTTAESSNADTAKKDQNKKSTSAGESPSGETSPAGNSQTCSVSAEKAREILTAVLKAAENDPDIKAKTLKSIAAIYTTVRNLSTIYSGRQLNFQENDLVRNAYIESIANDIEFGKSILDYVKTLPSVIAAGGAGLGISFLLNMYGILSLSTYDLFIIAILVAGLAFFGNYFFRHWCIRRKVRQFVWWDSDRNHYYEHYLNRSYGELKNLHKALVRIQNPDLSKGEDINKKCEAGEKEIQELFTSLYPTTCKDINLCIFNRDFDPNKWVFCETRGSSTQDKCLERKPRSYPPLDPKEQPPQYSACTYAPGQLSWRCFIPRIIPWRTIGQITMAVIAIAVIAAIAYFLLFVPSSGPVSFTKALNTSPVSQGETAAMSLTFKNSGSSAITNLTITDRCPEEFLCAEQNFTCRFTGLKSGESRTVEYLMRSGSGGKFIPDPATAEYTDSSGRTQIIQSNVPTISVVAGSSGALTRSNITEITDSLNNLAASLTVNQS